MNQKKKTPLKLATKKIVDEMPNTFNTRNMLVDFSMSSFRSIRRDKSVTTEVAHQYGVSEKVGNYNKRLFPFTDKDLDDLASKQGELRRFHRANTLPFGNGDTDLRVLPSANFLFYTDGIRKGRSEIEVLANNVASRWTELKEKARKVMTERTPKNGKCMFNEEDYPDSATYVSMHTVTMKVLPLPVAENAEDIQGLDPEQIEFVREAARAELLESQRAAMVELWERVLEVVTHARKILTDKNRIIRDSVFGNIAAICELVPRLNFENNEELNEIVTQLRRLSGTNLKVVRGSKITRRHVANSVEEIERKMAAIMPKANAA